MLNRVLTALMERESLRQAAMIDDMGRLLAGVTEPGQPPEATQQIPLLVAALEAQQQLGLGELHEVWTEGKERTLLDLITPYRVLILQGQVGRLGRWRHSVDHLRSALAHARVSEVNHHV